MSNLAVSVIIATLNRPEDLRRALTSLALQTGPVDQILVVDQSTDERTKNVVVEMKERYSPALKGISYHFLAERSAVKARNFGIKNSDFEIISFVDDDAELFPDYFEKVKKYFIKNPSLGALGGSVVYQKEPRGLKWVLRLVLFRFFLLNWGDGKMTASGFGYPIYERGIRKVTPVEMLHGCNMNFRRSAIGDERFDEWFTGYSFREDAEFSYRISRKSKVWMVPDAKLYHHESPSNRLDVENLKEMQIRNYYYVFKKHRRRSFFSKWFFFFSLSGLLLLDVLEFLSRRDQIRRRGLSAAAAVSWKMFFKK